MIGPIKTAQEIDAMREGGKILATIFRDLRKIVTAGISEIEINDWVKKEIKAYGAIATYQTEEVKFPGVICISTNDEIVHSIPTEYVLKDGDIVGFDLVITYQGMKTDSAFSVAIGTNVPEQTKHLLSVTERSLFAGIEAIKGPTKTGDIGAVIESVLREGKLGIIRELVGHGIGHSMHKEPEVPNYGHRGSERIKMGDDKWTIKTVDGSLAAHFEHTVLVGENSAEILTAL